MTFACCGNREKLISIIATDSKIAPQIQRFCSTNNRRHKKCSAVQSSEVYCTALQYSTVQYSTVKYNVLQFSTAQYSTVQRSAV
jgi:hypothetical protein